MFFASKYYPASIIALFILLHSVSHPSWSGKSFFDIIVAIINRAKQVKDTFVMHIAH
jgi:hypothetical protein